MKICWNNLEKLHYSKKTGKWYDGLGHIYTYIESCKNCGEPFLSPNTNNKGLYCCISCARTGKNNPMYGKHLSEETKKKMSEMRKDENHPNWKGGVTKRNLPLYDTYAPKIEWCEEVRRNAEEPNILEVKCTHCGKWFIPKQRDVANRLQYLKGCENSERRFYCSKACKNACPLYDKSPETLMREDAVRSGRLKWLKMSREVQHELREMVLERDNYTCRKCGSKDKPLHCHHIEPVAINPIESADIDNCITLCEDCHREAHSKDGCGYGQLRICEEDYESTVN
jgi:5-methylcytosine-specific restriction endonuclease McrA